MELQTPDQLLCVWHVGGVAQAVVVACVLCCRAVAYEGIDTWAYGGAGRAGDRKGPEHLFVPYCTVNRCFCDPPATYPYGEIFTILVPTTYHLPTTNKASGRRVR